MTLSIAETSFADERASDRVKSRYAVTERWTTGFRLVVVAAVLAGCFFRVYQIDRHFYWNDEIATSLRIAGYRVAEVEAELRDKGMVRVAEMQKYQTLGPDRTAGDTIRGLAQEEPQLAPLYFVLARQWVRWFGDSITVSRSFSVFVSLLALPCMFVLCRRLFDSSDVGLLAVALLAVSPAHVVFAQEARPYSLFVLLTLLSSIALLRALAPGRWYHWLLYSVAVLVGLYTQVLFAAVACSHALYVVVRQRRLLCRETVSYAIASAAALGGFIPWILVILYSGAQGTSWTQTHQTLTDVLIRWAGITSRAFFDVGIAPGDPLVLKLAVLPVIALLLVLIAYSLWFTARTAKKDQWFFAISLAASVALPLFLLDFVLGRRYGTTRYILPSLVGMQAVIAYMLVSKSRLLAGGNRRAIVWPTLGVVLIAMGVLSCAVRSQAETWWNKSPDKYGDYPHIAQIINESDRPVVYCYGPWRMTQMMCHLLDSDVQVQLLGNQSIPQVQDGLSEAFVFNSEEDERSRIEQALGVRVQPVQGDLWKIHHNP